MLFYFIALSVFAFLYTQLAWLVILPSHNFGRFLFFSDAPTTRYFFFSSIVFIFFLVFGLIGFPCLRKDGKALKKMAVLFILALLAFFWQKIFPHNRVLNAVWYFRVPLFSLAISLYWFWFWPKWKLKWKLDKIIWLELAIFFFLYSALSLLRHWHFQSTAWDLALYDNLFWRYAHFKDAYSPIREMNLLGDHFHLVFFLFVPIYKIYPHPETLLILQAFLITLSAYPIYLLSQKYFKHIILSLILVFGYLTFNGIQTAVDFDFHATTIGVVFLVFAFYFLIEKKWLLYFLFAALAIFSKEDYPVFVFFMGVYALIFRKEWLAGTLTILFGAVSYYLIINLAMPHFQAAPAGYFIFNAFGKTPLEIIKNIILHPLFTFNYIFNEIPKIISFLTYFSSFGFLVFLSPSVLILGAPQLAEKFLTDRWPQWGPWNHYAAPLAFVLAFGAMRTIHFLSQKYPGKKFLTAGAIFLFLCSLLINFAPGAKLGKLTQLRSWRFSREEKIKKEFLHSLATNVSLATQADLAPHLSGREKIYLFVSGVTGKINEQKADLLVLNPHGATWPIEPNDFDKMMINLLQTGKYAQNSPQYELWQKEGEIYVFKQKE